MLGGDPAKFSYYRAVVADPVKAVQDPKLRPYVVEVAEKLFDLLFSDAQMYNRVRTLLKERGKELT